MHIELEIAIGKCPARALDAGWASSRGMPAQEFGNLSRSRTLAVAGHRQGGDEACELKQHVGLAFLGVDLTEGISPVREVAEQGEGPFGEVARPAVNACRELRFHAADQG